ncbi:MAG TPA: group III truncated hemoglobin, partial [Lacunisphaera sp.]|nr:group III truncated hemoglobin [Lacunisphaera sp.]
NPGIVAGCDKDKIGGRREMPRATNAKIRPALKAAGPFASARHRDTFHLTMPDALPSPASLFVRLGGRPQLMQLLKYFYADVRQHAEIGPIFAAHITDWPAHLEKIADFWSGATGGPAGYRGDMPMKHLALGLEERHFEAWLGLWSRHCRARLAPTEAAELIRIAETIGQRLRQIVGVRPRAQ